MGMFDDIRYDGKAFQTKDFGCHLDQYEIKDGRLLLHKFKTEELPESEWKPDVLGIIRKTKFVPDCAEDLNFHGWVNFYDCDIHTREWTEYNAKFTDGQMVEIQRVPNQ